MGAEKAVEIWKRVPSHFDPRALGESLKEVAIDYIETEDSNLQSRWFQSESDADLFIWTDVNRKKLANAQEIIKYQLSFFGQVVEWSIFDGVRTGVIIENEIQGESPSEVIEFDQHPQMKPIEQATRLLRFVTELGHVEQQYLISVLSQKGLAPITLEKQRSKSARATFQSLLKWMHLKK